MSNDETIDETAKEAEEAEVQPEPAGSGGAQRITLSYESAISFAAEGLMDAYDIASTREDTSTMIKISNSWLHMAAVLGQADESSETHKHEKTNPVGFTHDLEIELESAVE